MPLIRSCPDLVRASTNRTEADLRLVDGRAKPGHERPYLQGRFSGAR